MILGEKYTLDMWVYITYTYIRGKNTTSDVSYLKNWFPDYYCSSPPGLTSQVVQTQPGKKSKECTINEMLTYLRKQL